MEEKRATAAANKAFADKDADREAVVDESTLMGSGGGFAEAIRKRDAAKIKREQEREMQMREKREGDRERLEERKRKEEDTMAMYVSNHWPANELLSGSWLTCRFREMAKNRFG
jgi:predicted transposase YbfD/YdcC